MVKLPLSKLEPWSPFENVVWGTDLEEPLTQEEVKEAIASEDFKVDPDWSPDLDDRHHGRRAHVARVAYLVVHGWDDPIDFEADPHGWCIYDGNHRLAAAIFRGDTEIEVNVGGFLNYAADLLGISEEELSQGF